MSNVYLVWETHMYEAWALCAIFANEEAARACAEQLNDESYAELMEARRGSGSKDEDRFDAHIVDEMPLHNALAEWDAAKDGGDND